MRWLAYAAVWVFVFSVPWENVLVIPGIGVVSRLTGMLAMGLTVLMVVVSGRIRSWRAFHVAALLFVFWAGFVLWLNATASNLPLKFWTYPQLFLVLWLVWEMAPSRRHQLGLFLAYILGASVTAVQTVMAYRTHGDAMRRFSAGATDPNAVAMTLALALPMAWYLGMTYRQPLLRWICRMYLPVGLLGIGLTASRGGLLAAIVGLLIVPLTMTRLSPARLATAIAILGISGAVAVAYVPDRIVERFATTTSSVETLDLGGRFRIWKAGVQAFAYKPLTGYGTGSFRAAASPWLRGDMRVAHNSFLSVLVEQGLVGFLLYLAMFLAVFRAVVTLPPLERRFGLVLLATLLMTMLPLTWEDSKPVWFILAALLGFANTQVFSRRRVVLQADPRMAGPMVGLRRAPRPRQPLTGPFRNADPGRPTA